MTPPDQTVPDAPDDGPPVAAHAGDVEPGADQADDARPDPDDDQADEPEAARRRLSRRWIVLGAVVAVITAAVVAAALIRVPYYLLEPGSVRRTEDLITVQGAPTYPQEGEIGYTTVSVQPATALEWALAHFDDTVTIVSEKAYLGTQSPDQNRLANLQMMTDSKETASAVALEHLGYEVKVNGTGAVIVALAENSPSKDVLQQGDTIVSVDTTPIQLADQLVTVIGSHKPGDTVTLGVQPNAADRSRTTENRTITLAARPDDPSKAYLGVSSQTRDPSYDLPVQVSVDSGAVGGSSAGLAFTLGIMDVMTQGSLTGGHKVATTGTINPDGSVGPIGGIQQKVFAVRASGAELFLVPRSEYDEAEKYAGSLRVEPVDDVDDALKVLATLGGGTDVLPTTTTTAPASATTTTTAPAH